MKNIITTVAVAGLLTVPGLALAEDIAPAPALPLPVSAFVEPDVYYAIDAEQINAEVKMNVSAFNAYLEVIPTFSVDDLELTSSTAELGYNLEVNVATVTPYVKTELDEDFNSDDTIVGIKAHFGF